MYKANIEAYTHLNQNLRKDNYSQNKEKHHVRRPKEAETSGKPLTKVGCQSGDSLLQSAVQALQLALCAFLVQMHAKLMPSQVQSPLACGKHLAISHELV